MKELKPITMTVLEAILMAVLLTCVFVLLSTYTIDGIVIWKGV